MRLAPELLHLINVIQSWIQGGASAEAIRERLGNPGGVAEKMLERAVSRQQEGGKYLGRLPAMLRLPDQEPEPEPEPESEKAPDVAAISTKTKSKRGKR